MNKQDCYIPQILYNNNDLSLRAKILYSELVSAALKNNSENVYAPFAITQAQMAEMLKVSKPTAIKELRALIKYGLLDYCGRDIENKSIYVLKNVDWLKEWTG